jgi:ankyrin repeat protein
MGNDDASVLKDAIKREEHAFVESLLGGSSISPVLASECVSYIPKQTSPEMRSSMLKMLLRSGASGDPLHEMLIDATEAGDTACVGLLLKPYIRERTSMIGATPGLDEGNQEPSFFRHAVASPDYKSGEALRTAVLRGDQLLVNALLEGRPSHDTLAKVFPLTSRLEPQDRYKMIELFLQGALAGPSLHSALQTALSEERTSRDGALIQLLLEHNADINYTQGAGLRTIISDLDIQLLAVLLQKASPQTAAARIADVMAVPDHKTRHDMVVLLLRAGAAIGASEVASALLRGLEESPVDMSLLRLLLQSGSADVNAFEGAIIQRAVRNPDPKVLELVLGLGKPNPESISRGLTELGPLPSTEGKTWKLKVILSKSSKQEDLGGMLVNEVQSLVKNRKRSPSFSTLKHLLDSGADTNAYGAAALHHAVRSSDTHIMDILFASESKPTSSSLGSALPHALRISDPMDRLTFTKRLVEAGAEPLELNRALIHAINTYKDDLSLLTVLADAADTADGEALSLAVSKESTDIADILLARTSHTEELRDATLQKALAITDREKRREICGIILKAGTSPANTSAALLIAARDGDLPLGDVLIAHGATISPKSPSPIVEACRHGSTSILGVLLKASPATDGAILKRGFQAATEVGDLNKRAVIFGMLLERGVKGEIVDMQLGSAARYGDDGYEILRVLLAAGADPDYNRGDAVVAATKSAFLRNLELLLGLWDEKQEQVCLAHISIIAAIRQHRADL